MRPEKVPAGGKSRQGIVIVVRNKYMIKQLYKEFLVTFLIIMIVPSTSTAGRIKKHALKQVIGKVISINKTTNTLTLSCRKVKHSISAHNLDNVSVGEWVIAKVDEKGEAAISVRADQIAHCGKEDLIQIPEIRKVFIKDDMLFITNKKGRKKRIEIDHWMVAHSPNKQIIVYTVGFYYGKEALVLITDNKGAVKHAIDVGDESHVRYLDDDIEWVNDRLVKVSGNVNNSIDQYLIFDAAEGTLLRSYVVSDCALSWSPAKDKIALCGFYPPTTPEEYQSNGLQIDETPMLPIKGKSFMDSQDALGSIYPSEAELEKEPGKSVHKFETNFLWSPNGKQLAFIDELQQVVTDDETKLLGRYLIIVNVLEKTSTMIPLPELSVDNIKHPDDVGKSIRWSKDGRFIRLDKDNLSFDTGENKFIKEMKEPEIKPDSKGESNKKHHE